MLLDILARLKMEVVIKTDPSMDHSSSLSTALRDPTDLPGPLSSTKFKILTKVIEVTVCAS